MHALRASSRLQCTPTARHHAKHEQACSCSAVKTSHPSSKASSGCRSAAWAKSDIRLGVWSCDFMDAQKKVRHRPTCQRIVLDGRWIPGCAVRPGVDVKNVMGRTLALELRRPYAWDTQSETDAPWLVAAPAGCVRIHLSLFRQRSVCNAASGPFQARRLGVGRMCQVPVPSIGIAPTDCEPALVSLSVPLATTNLPIHTHIYIYMGSRSLPMYSLRRCRVPGSSIQRIHTDLVSGEQYLERAALGM